jgi:hypothetical protein
MRKLIQNPKKGDTKIKTKFLWFPLTINNEKRWLEKATYELKYDVYNIRLALFGIEEDCGWCYSKWLS